MSRFKQTDHYTMFLMPPSLEDWLPENHLARFVMDIVAQLDLRAIKDAYEGRGSAAHNPKMLLGLLFYGYSTGVFTSRKIERATYDSVAFRYIVGKLEEQLAGEINELLQMAEQEDAIAVPDGMDVPEEIARRQDRL
ncbi:MAG: transposase, partial [Syntrophales bacterium]